MAMQVSNAASSLRDPGARNLHFNKRRSVDYIRFNDSRFEIGGQGLSSHTLPMSGVWVKCNLGATSLA